MLLKQLEGVPGVYHPADWGESEIMHLRMAYNEGKRHGAQEGAEAMLYALTHELEGGGREVSYYGGFDVTTAPAVQAALKVIEEAQGE